MTLIASIHTDGCVLLMADTLISGNEQEYPAKFPNFKDVSEIFPRGSGFVPTGLRQKICVVSEHLVVAWSGNQIFALTAIRELKSRFSSTSVFSTEMISGFFENLDSQIRENCCFCVMASCSGYTYSYRWNGQEITGSDLGTIFVAGSGAESLFQILRQPSYLDRSSGKSEKEVNGLDLAVSKVIALCSNFNFLELVTGSNFTRYFGGAYEIAIRVKEKFQKLKEVTYLSWLVDVQKDHIDVLSTGVVIKNFYIKDILFVRRVLLDVSCSPASLQDDFFVIMPMLDVEIVNGEKFELPPIHSEFTSTSFLVRFESSEERVVHNMISCVRTSPPVLSFFFGRSGIEELEFSKQYVQQLTSYVEQKFPGKEIKFGMAERVPKSN